MEKYRYRLGYTTPEEGRKLSELGFSNSDLSTYNVIGKGLIPCWSITRIVDILENNGIKVSYENKSWCLKTNVIEQGLRHCFVGSNLTELVIEMLESKIVELK